MTLRLVTVIFLGMLLAARARGQEIDEYQVKAAFLYNFAKFVEWPRRTFQDTQGSDRGLRVGAQSVWKRAGRGDPRKVD